MSSSFHLVSCMITCHKKPLLIQVGYTMFFQCGIYLPQDNIDEDSDNYEMEEDQPE